MTLWLRQIYVVTWQYEEKISQQFNQVPIQDVSCQKLWKYVSVCQRYVENTVDFFPDAV